MHLKKYTWLIIFLFPLQLFAQDITGVWKGEFYVDSTKKTYPFELSISENKGKLTGYSRISFEEDGIPQVVFRDHTIKKDGDNYIIEDDRQLAKASSIPQPREVKKIMIVSLLVQDSVMILKGDWSTSKTKHFLAARGTVSVQRKNDFRETAIFKKLDELKLTSDLSFNKPEEKPDIVLNRNTEKVQTTVAAVPTKPVKQPAVTAPQPIAVNIPMPEKPKEIPIAKAEAPPVVKQPVITPTPKAPIVVKTTTTKPVVTKEIVKAQPVITKPVTPISKPAAPVAVVPKPIPVQALPAVVAKNAAVDVKDRNNSSIQSLYYSSDSLQLTLYDNGEVDGDTVSVLLNGKVIIANQRLDIKPNIHTIYFDKDTPDSMLLVMYAENLGSIPPNTGLLVVHDGKAVYEVRFSADLSSNAAIILRRKKRP